MEASSGEISPGRWRHSATNCVSWGTSSSMEPAVLLMSRIMVLVRMLELGRVFGRKMCAGMCVGLGGTSRASCEYVVHACVCIVRALCVRCAGVVRASCVRACVVRSPCVCNN